MEFIDLPAIVDINDESQDPGLRQKLRVESEPFTFPLSKVDLNLLARLEAKYDSLQSASGLAAPQIGINKQAIIIEIPDDPVLKKWRSDLTDTIPKTLWLNPSYAPVSNDINIDYEACFSVGGIAGKVPRYKTITYNAFLKDGTEVKGVVNGFLARVIQHEIDHIHGILYPDHISDSDLMDLEEYRAIKRASMEKQTV